MIADEIEDRNRRCYTLWDRIDLEIEKMDDLVERAKYMTCHLCEDKIGIARQIMLGHGSRAMGPPKVSAPYCYRFNP